MPGAAPSWSRWRRSIPWWLPALGDSSYNGGASDGFVAWLDPVNYSPRSARFLGGPGTDEILSILSWSNDLFLVGFTDSLTLSVPGLMP